MNTEKMWEMYEEEFWLWLDVEIERIETVLENLKKIREKKETTMKITENELCCKKCQKVAKTTKVGDKIKCRDCDSILAKSDGAKRYGGIPCIRYVPTNQGELKTTITYEED